VAVVAALTLRIGGVAADEAAPPTADVGFALFLLQHGLPDEAARELERLAQIGAAGPPLYDAAAVVGGQLARDGRPAEAARALRLAVDGAEDPAEADRRRLALGTVLLAARDWTQGADVLSRVEAFGAREPERERARRLLCVGHVLSLQSGPASGCVAALLPPADGRAARAGPLLARLSIEPDRRAWIGGILSAVLPGLGQATGGEPLDGLKALLVNGGWEVGTVLLAADALYVDASILAVGVGLRYYIGNVKHGADAWRRAAERTREAAGRDLARLLAGSPRLSPASAPTVP